MLAKGEREGGRERGERERERERRERERGEREMLIMDINKMLLVFFFFISAGGIRDFSHKSRRGGGEAGSTGNSPFLAGIAKQGKAGEKVIGSQD